MVSTRSVFPPKAIEYYHNAHERGRGQLYPFNVSYLGNLNGDMGIEELAELYYKKRLNVTGDSADYYIRFAFLERRFIHPFTLERINLLIEELESLNDADWIRKGSILRQILFFCQTPE